MKKLKSPKKNASVSEMKAYVDRVEKRKKVENEKATLRKRVEKIKNGK